MFLKISVPAKTFFLGEYLALKAGPAFLLTTHPRFELSVKKSNTALKGIHPASPAGSFYDHNADFFQNYQLEFVDPYQGAGGFGASTAQFALLYALKNHLLCLSQESEVQVDIKDLLAEYQAVAWNGQGFPPSGADLVAQVRGQMTYFCKQQGVIKSSPWNLHDLSFALVKTNLKIPTHEHLKSLNDFDSSHLQSIVEKSAHAFSVKDTSAICDLVNQYQAELAKLNLAHPKSLALQNKFKSQSFVKAVKGCGALGADVLLLLFHPQDFLHIQNYVQEQGLKLVATQEQLSEGLDFHGSLGQRVEAVL